MYFLPILWLSNIEEVKSGKVNFFCSIKHSGEVINKLKLRGFRAGNKFVSI